MASNCVDGVLRDICGEAKRIMLLHTPFNSAHESYAVILEELQEFWAEVCKKRADRDKRKMREELVQTAAACVRSIVDLDLAGHKVS